jgi:hypothetical protein
MIKRYDFYVNRYGDVEREIEEDGDYVEYEDHLKELENKTSCDGCGNYEKTYGECHDCMRGYVDYYTPKDDK